MPRRKAKPRLEPQLDEGPLIPRPASDDFDVLQAYVMQIQDRRACMAYDEIVDRCRWCMAIGRYIPEEGERGGVFCTEECRDQSATFKSQRKHPIARS
jgi:hypothetical protein